MTPLEEMDFRPGDVLSGFVTGRANPWHGSTRKSVNRMISVEGFAGIYQEPPFGRLIWLYRTDGAASKARRMTKAAGLSNPSRLTRFVITDDLLPQEVDQ